MARARFHSWGCRGATVAQSLPSHALTVSIPPLSSPFQRFATLSILFSPSASAVPSPLAAPHPVFLPFLVCSLFVQRRQPISSRPLPSNSVSLFLLVSPLRPRPSISSASTLLFLFPSGAVEYPHYRKQQATPAAAACLFQKPHSRLLRDNRGGWLTGRLTD